MRTRYGPEVPPADGLTPPPGVPLAGPAAAAGSGGAGRGGHRGGETRGPLATSLVTSSRAGLHENGRAVGAWTQLEVSPAAAPGEPRGPIPVPPRLEAAWAS